LARRKNSFRKGPQSLGDAARGALRALGMGDYEFQERSRKVFEQLYGDRFAGQVRFLGLRRGIVYLRVRDGSWVRRVKAFEAQIIRDLLTLAELDEAPKYLSIKVGPAPELDG
jgi:hypothetical protein